MATDSQSLRERLHEIIFEADTPAGKWFDVLLLVFIFGSVLMVALESIPELQVKYKDTFQILEWVFTIIFTIEYVLRLWTVNKPWHYARSFYGIIDLLSILPLYLSFFIAGTQYFVTIRALRLLRVFRILKLANFMQNGQAITQALLNSRSKIIVFLYFMMIIVTIIGSVMYFIEGTVNSNFSSIPASIYWAIVTVTTVGYGDISPITPLGQFISSILMILGYAVIAVPTGIVSVEIADVNNKMNTQHCPSCGKEGHDNDAEFCKFCGEDLHPS